MTRGTHYYNVDSSDDDVSVGSLKKKEASSDEGDSMNSLEIEERRLAYDKKQEESSSHVS
jgi:hypothetical protein